MAQPVDTANDLLASVQVLDVLDEGDLLELFVLVTGVVQRLDDESPVMVLRDNGQIEFQHETADAGGFFEGAAQGVFEPLFYAAYAFGFTQEGFIGRVDQRGHFLGRQAGPAGQGKLELPR